MFIAILGKMHLRDWRLDKPGLYEQKTLLYVSKVRENNSKFFYKIQIVRRS